MSCDDPCTHADSGPGCDLIRQLRLTRIDADRFVGTLRSGRTEPERAFGGCLIAQALLAAGATMPTGQAPGSLHAYFVSPGDVSRPIRYTIGQLGGGRSSTLCQVTADQEGATRLVMFVSFRRFSDAGTDHQRTAPVRGLPPAADDAAFTGTDHAASAGADDAASAEGHGGIADGLFLHAAAATPEPGAAPGAYRASWVRLRHELGTGPLWHAAVLSYASDIATIRTVDQPHRGEPGRRLGASVDHAMWFHRPFRADEWLWYAQRSPVYTGGRGTCQGEFYDTAGRLVASCAQEVSLRRAIS